ncbi:hypothetical protein Pcinc_007189 [Petrolisthes cinctipes]|uniref:C-type lectin domain-containing protein n=1 Tax=Petrolisthes cinctipes TaxID=88211 RepID=A0AAE1KYT3_PETCI|nr:hypothetical protein Pcinc_007189 [Petrolisthes cinctipes]
MHWLYIKPTASDNNSSVDNMISPTVLLFFLALGCVLSQPHAPTTITNNGTTTTTTQVSTSLSRQDATTTDDKVTVNIEDLHTSIVVNQLAILKHMKDTSAKFASSPTLFININCPASSPTLFININCPTSSPTLFININCPASSPTLFMNINCPASSPNLFMNINCPASSPNLFMNISCPASSPNLFINITCPDNESHKLQPQLVELKELMLQLQAQNNQSQEIKQELLELKEMIVEFNQSFATPRSTAPNVDFSDLLAKDCVHLERSHKTWEEARANCISLGGDLFVAGDYEGAREYLKKEVNEGLSNWPWVGVKGKLWLDDQQVSDDEWDDDSPGSNNDSCSFLHERGLEDMVACSSSTTSLCVKGSYYWTQPASLSLWQVYGDLSWRIHLRVNTLDDLLSLCVLARKINPLFSPWFDEILRQTTIPQKVDMGLIDPTHLHS